MIGGWRFLSRKMSTLSVPTIVPQLGHVQSWPSNLATPPEKAVAGRWTTWQSWSNGRRTCHVRCESLVPWVPWIHRLGRTPGHFCIFKSQAFAGPNIVASSRPCSLQLGHVQMPITVHDLSTFQLVSRCVSRRKFHGPGTCCGKSRGALGQIALNLALPVLLKHKIHTCLTSLAITHYIVI